MVSGVTPPNRREAGRTAAPRNVTRCGVLLVFFCLLGIISTVVAQGEPGSEDPVVEPDPWEPFRLLEGTWEGAIDGRLGQGTGKRRYEFVLDGIYLLSRHASVRLPQEKSPRGDLHRELAIYSLDRERNIIVLRQFVVEGWVLRYRCVVEPDRFVCTTENVESGTGLRARLTVQISNRYQFDEIFELASSGKEFEVYFTNRWTRTPDMSD